MTKAPTQAFIVSIEMRACKCEAPRAILFTSRSRDRAIAIAGGHWSLYVTFYGEMVNWHDVIVVDTRDGVIIWRNGHLMKEGKHGESRAAQNGRARGDVT